MPNPLRGRRRTGGRPYPNIGAQLVSASLQYASVADNASLSMGAEIDFTIAFWANFPTSPGTNQAILAKEDGTGTSREYRVRRGTGGALAFIVSNDGVALVSLFGSTALAAGLWYFGAAQHDAVANQLRLYLNAASDATPVAHTTGVFDGTSPFELGRYSGSTYTDCVLDCVGIWKSAAGGGGALTVPQLAQVYKGGVGMAYRDLTADLKAALVAWYDLDGNLNDSHGSNHLTDNGGIKFLSGKR